MNAEDIIVLTDDEGNELDFRITMEIGIGGRRYAVLVAVDPKVEETALLGVQPGEGEVDELVDIEDLEEFVRVADAWDAVERGRDYCRQCGCTDEHACPGGCAWVAPGLCSSCVDKIAPGAQPA